MMYYRRFGLSGAPFQFTPSPRMLYPSRTHCEGLAVLERALSRPEDGFTLLTGDAGSGKTTLALATLARQSRWPRTVYLANPKVGYDAMMLELVRQSGITEHGGHREMMEALDRHLAKLDPGEGVLVLVDEAQNLSDTSLERLRSFRCGEHGGAERLHFALIGRPELLNRLATPKLKQFNELVQARVALRPLRADESANYVGYRLAAYDGSVQSIFAPAALEHLLEHARGGPRRINILCHNAMLIAHGSDAAQVTLAASRTAVREFEKRTLEWPQPASRPIHAAMALRSEDAPSHGPALKRHNGTAKASRLCIGIGLLALSTLLIGALYLANFRSTYGAGGQMARGSSINLRSSAE
jgi:type II secretory pathway predicted ATPase ExeA